MEEKMSNKMENEKDKNIVGKACIISIFVASVFSNIYKIFELNIRVLNEINETIIDASSFLNIVCISYLVVSLIPKRKNRKLAVWCIINLILINQLYSNNKLFEIGLYLKSCIQRINPYIAAFCGIVFLVSVFVAYRLYRRNKTSSNNDGKQKGAEHDGILQKEQHGIEKIDSEAGSEEYRETKGIPGGETKEKKEVLRHREIGEERNSRKEDERQGLNGNTNTIFLSIFLFMLLAGIISYCIYLMPDSKISKLVGVLWTPEIMYSICVLCGIVSLLVLIVRFAGYVIKQIKIWGDNGKGLTFRGSAILAIMIIIVLCIYADNIDQVKWTNNLILIITDNGLSLLVGIFLMFLVLQIIIIMVGNLLFRPEKTDTEQEPIVTEMSMRTREIELRIVKLALNLVEGGIAIFDFIPDFFTTIAALLLGKKINLGNLENEKKNETSDKSKKNEESENI